MANAGAIRAGRAYVELFADSSKLQKNLKQAESSLKAFGDKASNIGAQFASVGVAAALPIAMAVKGYAAFDDQMRAVQAVSGATGAQFESLTEKAKELGRTTSFTAAQVAEGMVNLGRAGFQSTEIDASIAQVMNLSRATQTEIPMATDIAGNALRSFGLDADEMGRVCDVLTVTANGSSQTLEDLGEAFKFVAPIAKDAGLSIEDASKIVGTLANFGLKGSLAGTAFKNIQLKMADPAVQKSYADLGVSVVDAAGNLRNMSVVLQELGAKTAAMPNAEKLATYKDLFGMYGLSGGVKLSTASFDEFYAAIDNASGRAQEIADKMDAGIGGSFRLTESALEGVGHAIGEAFTPAITDAANKIMDVASVTTAWIKDNQDTVVTVGKGAAALIVFGGGLFALGQGAKLASSTITGLRAITLGFGKTLDVATGYSARATAALQAKQAAEVAEANVAKARNAYNVAEIAYQEALAAARQANTLEIQAETAATLAETAATQASVATAQEEAAIRSALLKQKNLETTATAAATKARLLENRAMAAQADLELAVASGAKKETVAKLKAAAQKAAARAAEARLDAQAAAQKVAATEAEIAAINAEIAARGKASVAAVAEARARLAAAKAAAEEARAKLASATRTAAGTEATLANTNAELANATATQKAAVATSTLRASLLGLVQSVAPLAIIAGLAYALEREASAAKRASNAARAATEAVQKQNTASANLRAEQQQMFDRIQELSNKQNLSNQEFAEGCEIVRQLRNYYGDLGIEIDATAKSFVGASDAAKKFAEQQRKLQVLEVRSEILALQHQLDANQREFDSTFGTQEGGKKKGALQYAMNVASPGTLLVDAFQNRKAITNYVTGRTSEENAIRLSDERQELQAQINGAQSKLSMLEAGSAAAEEDATIIELGSTVKTVSEDDLKDAQKTTSEFEKTASDSFLSDAEKKREEVRAKYEEYQKAQEAILTAAREANPLDETAATTYDDNMSKADEWRDSQFAKIDKDERKERRENLGATYLANAQFGYDDAQKELLAAQTQFGYVDSQGDSSAAQARIDAALAKVDEKKGALTGAQTVAQSVQDAQSQSVAARIALVQATQGAFNSDDAKAAREEFLTAQKKYSEMRGSGKFDQKTQDEYESARQNYAKYDVATATSVLSDADKEYSGLT